jgi:hypothetical protein
MLNRRLEAIPLEQRGSVVMPVAGLAVSRVTSPEHHRDRISHQELVTAHPQQAVLLDLRVRQECPVGWPLLEEEADFKEA